MRKLAPAPRGLPSTYAGMSTRVQAQGASVPAPIEGWDAVSPLAAMSPKRAVKMENWFPQQSWIELRKGYIVHSDTGTGAPVETIASYHGTTTNELFAWSDGGIYNVTAQASSGVADVSGLANSRSQTTMFTTTGGNFLYTVNGADLPQYYDGSTWATPTITGSGISSSDFVHINAHKNRLWFVINDSTDAAYLPVDSIQGAAAKFPFGGLFTLGGYLVALGTWSVDAGTGPEDYLVGISSQGQVAIYSGIDPATDFRLVGVFDLGDPIGRRCFTKVGADIALICIDGVLPLSKAMIFERAAVVNASLTERIQRVMNQSARDYVNNFGWQLISYPRGTRAILNVPVEENGAQEQYVMNTLSGAWCRFTGMEANCWEVFLDDPYFGGNDGVVYRADTGSTDVNNILNADVMTAFNYFNSRGNNKRWMMCRALLTTDQTVNPGIAFNVDFQDNAPISFTTTQQASVGLWDVSLWDVGIWGGAVTTQANWTSVTGLGYCASIRLQVQIAQPVAEAASAWGTGQWGSAAWSASGSEAIVLQVNGFDLTYERGAFI